MRKNLRKYAAAAPFILAFGLACSIPAMAEPSGHLDWANSSAVAGWAWDADSPDDTMEVTINIARKDTGAVVRTLTVAAESYRGDLAGGSNNGSHGFFCPVDWKQLSGDSFTVTAYVLSGEKSFPLTGMISYDTSAEGTVLADSSAEVAGGPLGPLSPLYGSSSESSTESGGQTQSAGSASTEQTAQTETVSSEGSGPLFGPLSTRPDPAASAESGWKQGASLGSFKITGYCSCSICSGGWGLTYSGTVPQANHTISADLNVFPIGTKLMINGIVYTVEDMGSGVNGNHIDIYFASHDEAVAFGTQSAEVFAVIAE